MIERVAETTYRYSMFAPGSRVGVAVSGGADSVALLHVLKELAPRWNLALSVLHLNHGLRGEESDLDARFVEDLARSLGLACSVSDADVARQARETGDNLEQAARRARHEFFRGFLQRRELDRVALGHTRSDQAETVLYRLLRGTGSTGLSGIRPVTGEGFVRPLIETERAEVEAWLRSRGIAWREDASNRDLRFDRNRIRHDLLPQLTREWNPALPDVLARLAALAQGEEAYWEMEANRLLADLSRADPGGVLVHADRLTELPPAAARRVVRRVIENVKGDLRSVDFAHVENILRLAGPAMGSGVAQAPGLAVERSFDWLRFAPPEQPTTAAGFRFPVTGSGEFSIPGRNSVIRLTLTKSGFAGPSAGRGYNTEEGAALDWGKAGGSAELRDWQPGDRIRLPGDTRPRKIKELFQRNRIPLWERPGWPMLVKEDTILWTRRFGIGDGFAPGPGCELVLRIQECEVRPAD